jgi:hypothetical protein
MRPVVLPMAVLNQPQPEILALARWWSPRAPRHGARTEAEMILLRCRGHTCGLEK